MHPLVKSAIFHYEFEFIHPFADGNGRMGRLWHSLLLGTWKELFLWLPIEELIRTRQKEYYDALGKADKEADSSEFVRFMLEIILDTLKQTVVVGEAENNLIADRPSKATKLFINDEIDKIKTLSMSLKSGSEE